MVRAVGKIRKRCFLETTPLSALQTFISKRFKVGKWTRAQGIVFTGAANITGTCYIEQSLDGENWDYITSFDVEDVATFSVELVGDWVRFRFDNGILDQTEFRFGGYLLS